MKFCKAKVLEVLEFEKLPRAVSLSLNTCAKVSRRVEMRKKKEEPRVKEKER